MTATANGPKHTPLFPLPLVLFPNGELRLRIFERRYLDMVRDCSRSGEPFGVLAVVRENDHSNVCAIGTLAKIVDFDTLDDGLLGITCIGGSRFHVRHTHARDSGLMLGEIELQASGERLPVAPEYAALQQLVGNMIDTLGGRHASADKAQRDDSDWVANRIAEFFPFQIQEQQWLLEQNEPTLKLQQLVEWLPRFRSDEPSD